MQQETMFICFTIEQNVELIQALKHCSRADTCFLKLKISTENYQVLGPRQNTTLLAESCQMLFKLRYY